MKETPIGETFERGKLTMLVVESQGCGGCYFDGRYCDSEEPEPCDCEVRKDEKSVNFHDVTASIKTVEEIKRKYQPWEIEEACRALVEMNLNINL